MRHKHHPSLQVSDGWVQHHKTVTYTRVNIAPPMFPNGLQITGREKSFIALATEKAERDEWLADMKAQLAASDSKDHTLAPVWKLDIETKVDAVHVSCIQACMHAHIHTYIHTYTHTYIHTHASKMSRRSVPAHPIISTIATRNALPSLHVTVYHRYT